MQSAKEEREVWIGKCVAEAMNCAEGTDYRAILGPNPPDVLLVSETGTASQLGLEVVTLPTVDVAAREDNTNIVRLREELQERLSRNSYQVWVHLLDKAKRQRVPPKIVNRLVLIAQEAMANADSANPVDVDFTKAYAQYPDVAEYVSDITVAAFRGRKSVLVNIPLASWSPEDASWLQDAIAKKASYEPAVRSKWILAIDGSWLVDHGQIKAFKSSVDVTKILFRQIWLVTSFNGTSRLK